MTTLTFVTSPGGTIHRIPGVQRVETHDERSDIVVTIDRDDFSVASGDERFGCKLSQLWMLLGHAVEVHAVAVLREPVAMP